MTTRTVVTFFENEAGARLAADDLEKAGIDRECISITHEAGGFTGSLGGFFMPEADRHAFEEGIRRGGALLIARIPEVRIDLVVGALEDAGAVDFAVREGEWRAGGWKAHAGGDAPAGRHGAEPRRYGRREAGHGTGRVHVYYDPEDIDERTVGDLDAEPMGLNRSHPARHGGL